MSDDALAKALDAKAAAQRSIATYRNMLLDAQARISRHETEVAELDAWIAKWYQLTGIQPPRDAEQTEPTVDTEPKRVKNPDKELVAERAIQLIQQAGRPLSRREIFDALPSVGIELNGKDPEMVLSTMLWRMKERIVRIPNWGYWPAHIDFPAGAYIQLAGEDLLSVGASEPEDGVEAEDAE